MYVVPFGYLPAFHSSPRDWSRGNRALHIYVFPVTSHIPGARCTLTLHARTRHTLAILTQTTRKCVPVSRTNSLSLLKRITEIKIKKGTTRSPLQHKLHNNENVRVSPLPVTPEKKPAVTVLARRMPQFTTKQNKKKQEKRKKEQTNNSEEVDHAVCAPPKVEKKNWCPSESDVPAQKALLIGKITEQSQAMCAQMPSSLRL